MCHYQIDYTKNSLMTSEKLNSHVQNIRDSTFYVKFNQNYAFYAKKCDTFITKHTSKKARFLANIFRSNFEQKFYFLTKFGQK